jgi:hypothetical protein
MNIFQQFSKSLYSPKDIAKLRFQTIGKVILYVFFLTLISILPNSIYSTQEFLHNTHNIDVAIMNHLPSFTIEDSILRSSESEPSIVNHNDLVIMFDSSGKLSVDVLKEHQHSIGFFKNEFGYHLNGTIQTLPYSMLNNVTLTKSSIVTYLNTFESMIPIIIAFIITSSFIFSAGIKFIEISLIALLGLSLNKIVKKEVIYRKIWVISAYAITLATTFLSIMELVKITVISSYSIYWIVTIIMLYLSLREIPGKK